MRKAEEILDDILAGGVGTTEEVRAEAIAAIEQAQREALTFAARRMDEAISRGYPKRPDNADRCIHGQFAGEDCIGCYDEFLLAEVESWGKFLPHREGQ